MSAQPFQAATDRYRRGVSSAQQCPQCSPRLPLTVAAGRSAAPLWGLEAWRAGRKGEEEKTKEGRERREGGKEEEKRREEEDERQEGAEGMMVRKQSE